MRQPPQQRHLKVKARDILTTGLVLSARLGSLAVPAGSARPSGLSDLCNHTHTDTHTSSSHSHRGATLYMRPCLSRAPPPVLLLALLLALFILCLLRFLRLLRFLHFLRLKISGLAGAGAHAVLRAAEDLHRRAGRLRVPRVLHATERGRVHRRAAQLIVERLHRIAGAAGHGGRHAGAVRALHDLHARAADRAGARRAAANGNGRRVSGGQRSRARPEGSGARTGCPSIRGARCPGRSAGRAARAAAACRWPGPARKSGRGSASKNVGRAGALRRGERGG